MASEPLNTYVFTVTGDLFNAGQLTIAAENVDAAWKLALPTILEEYLPVSITVRRIPPHLADEKKPRESGVVGAA